MDEGQGRRDLSGNGCQASTPRLEPLELIGRWDANCSVTCLQAKSPLDIFKPLGWDVQQSLIVTIVVLVLLSSPLRTASRP